MYQIYNAKGEPVGNPKGYKTIASAESVINRRKSPLRAMLWKVAGETMVREDRGIVLYTIKGLRESSWK